MMVKDSLQHFLALSEVLFYLGVTELRQVPMRIAVRAECHPGILHLQYLINSERVYRTLILQADPIKRLSMLGKCLCHQENRGGEAISDERRERMRMQAGKPIVKSDGRQSARQAARGPDYFDGLGKRDDGPGALQPRAMTSERFGGQSERTTPIGSDFVVAENAHRT